MKKLITTLLLLSALTSFADTQTAPAPAPAPTPTPPACNVLRNAQATVFIYKTSWQQNNGIWVSSTSELMRNQTSIPVIADTSSGCTKDNFHLDAIPLNGSPVSITISSWIDVVTATPVTFPKRFYASYWTSLNGGVGGWADTSSADLNLNQITLNFQMNQTVNTATVHGESLTATIVFNDNAN